MPAPRSTPSLRFDSLQQQAFLCLWRTYDRLKALEDELFAQHGLSGQQYNVLRLLKSAAPEAMPTLALADRLVSKAPDITRIIDKLEQAALVRRLRPSGDRRTVLVSITEAGLARLRKLAAPLAQCHRRQLGHLSAADLRRLCRLLDAARTPHEQAGTPWGNAARR